MQVATLFSQHFALITPLAGIVLEFSSIPQEAFLPVNEYFTAASSPQQMCEATVRCNPESRISEANNMEKSLFI